MTRGSESKKRTVSQRVQGFNRLVQKLSASQKGMVSDLYPAKVLDVMQTNFQVAIFVPDAAT